MGFGLVRMGSQYAQRGNNFNDYVHMGTSASHSASDDLRVDSFTKKGFIKIASPKFDGDPTTEVTGGSTGKFILRENPLFSTKITKIISATKGEIEIAGSDALKAFIDDEFIIYRLGYPWEHGGGSAAESNEGTPLGHYYRRGVFIKSLDTNNNKVFLEHSSTKGFGNSTKNLLYSEYGPHTLLHDNYLSELYISPLRYWVNCEIYNRAESTKEKLPDVSYTHSLVCDSSTVVRDEFDPALTVNAPPNVSNLGLTFEEYLYSDTTVPANKWVLGEDAEKSIVERMVDYGFGTFKDGQSLNAMDLESGMGYINKQTAQANENIIELKGLVKVEKERLLDSSEKVTLLIKASRESTGSGTILSTKYSEVGWLPSRVAPRLTYVYKDALPTIEDFMVKPYKEDPFLSEYSWETSDDDLWYGFLILDRESILHQYHKASLHIPLNEVPAETVNDTLGYNNSNPFTKGEETFAYPYITGGQYTANIREASSVAVNLAPTVEGLAGNSLYFYGSTNTIDKQILVFKYPLPATTNLSILAHFTIDSLDSSSGRVRGIAQQTNNKGYIISAPEDANGTNNCYSIWIDSSGRVNAQVITKDLTADVTLISKYVVPVGTDEPVCVILTVDTELAVGNVKLFINGKLEDQSGKKTVAGSSNNWKTGQDIGEVDISIYVGSQSRNPGGGFDGVRSIKNMFNGTIEELVIYNHTIYPVIPTNGKMVLTKPIEELTDSSETAAGRPIVAKLFIKDYHNIRGKTREEVAQTSQISVRKAGLGLKTST